MENWPNFFIVGAIRSGTTSLYEYLKDVPSVYMSTIKEPGYFSKSVDTALLLTNPIRSKEKYLKLFENVQNETAIGEASPTYLWDPQAPKLIHQQVPDARIIMILRDPVARSYSHYLMGLGIGNETLPYKEAMQKALASENDYSSRIAMAGFYSEQVSRYLNLFPRENIKIFIFEEFIQDTKKSVQEVLDFLNVDTTIPDDVKIVDNTFDLPVGGISKHFIRNKILRAAVRELMPGDSAANLRKIFRKTSKKPPLSNFDKKLVEEIYREDAKKLENILGRNLPWPLLNIT